MANIPIWKYLRKSSFFNYRGEKVYLLTFNSVKNTAGKYIKTIESEKIIKYKHFQENTGKINYTGPDGIKVAMSVLVMNEKIDIRKSTSNSKKYYILKDGYKREIVSNVNDIGGGGFYKYLVNNTGDKYGLQL